MSDLSALRRLARLPSLALMALTLVLASAGFAAPAEPSPLAGTWNLIAADRIGRDGVRRADYGAHPHGRMMVTPDGRYATQIYSDERPRFAAGDKTRGTPEEFSQSVLGMSAHFGSIVVDEAAATLTFRIERSAYPNWEGTEQRRVYELKGDELSYQVPASATGDGSVAISVWRRAP